MLQNLLQKRNNSYYFRWKLPPDVCLIVEKTELIKSLHTSDRMDGLLRAQPYASFVQEIKRIRASFKMSEISEEQYKNIVTKMWSKIVDEQGLGESFKVMQDLTSSTSLHEVIGRLNEELQYYKLFGGVQYHRDKYLQLIDADINELLESEKIDPSKIDIQDDYFKEITKQNFNTWLYKFIAFNNLISDETIDADIDIPEEFKEKALANLPNRLATNTKTKESEAVNSHVFSQHSHSQKKLSELWVLHIEDKTDPLIGKWKTKSEKSVKEINAFFRDFIEILGEDKALQGFTREDAKNYQRGLLKLPVNRTKKYPNIPLNEIPADAKTIASKTASTRFNHISGFFKWLTSERYIEGINPFDGLSIAVESNPYATYEDEHISKLFKLDRNKSNLIWRYWIPRIALLTGARQNEIAQLTTNDICRDEKNGIYHFNITDTEPWQKVKNKNAIRIVPISESLIDHGFILYLNNLPNGHLWPDLKIKEGSYGQTVSTWWGWFSDIPPDKKGGAYVFHSLRKSAISQLVNYELTLRIIQELCGHEPALLGETKTYHKGTPITKLKEYIDTLDFDIE